MKKILAKVLVVMLLLTSVAVPAGEEKTVSAAAKKPKLSISQSVLERGEKKTLKVKPNGNRITKVTWRSTDTKVAKVSSKGVVSATGAGSATIKASFKINGAKKKPKSGLPSQHKKKSIRFPKQMII